MEHHQLHLVDLGHLRGSTDETCRQGRNPFNILRIILGHVNQAGLAIKLGQRDVVLAHKMSIIAIYVLHTTGH